MIGFTLLVRICALLQALILLQIVKRKLLRASADGARLGSSFEILAYGIAGERVRAFRPISQERTHASVMLANS